jgi:hypothetical protein
MDAKPKSNKLKRLEKKRKLELRAQRQAKQHAHAVEATRTARADRAMQAAKVVHRDLPRFLERLSGGENPPFSVNPELNQLAQLFSTIDRRKPGQYPLRPDADAFRRLVEVCWDRTDLLRGPEMRTFANAMLALSAHHRSWQRRPGNWEPRTHNSYRQFHSLVRHLVALYDVPTFMNSAWLEGLTTVGVRHQKWFIRVAQGENMRTAAGLPIPLTRRQAHLYLQAPDEFDILSAFRWAQIIDMGGNEQLVWSILTTRIGRSFQNDAFWVTVLRWLVEQPMLDPVHHGPIIDYLHNQRFVASMPNPLRGLSGQPLLVPPQPNLSMKGRKPESLLQAVADWHRKLGRSSRGVAKYWGTSGEFKPFQFEEGRGDTRKVYSITELLSSSELESEGRAMAHCVASYAGSCVAGHVSIWSLRVTDSSARESRLLTLEVSSQSRQIVQARQRFNALPNERWLSILQRWAATGGPGLSKWVAR